MNEGADVRSFSALQDLDMALARFAARTLTAFDAVEPEIKRQLEILEERRRNWTRQAMYWERAYEEADDEDEKRHAADKLAEAKEALRNIHYWQRQVAECHQTYVRHARRLREVCASHTAKARNYLQEKLAELQAYVAVQASGAIGSAVAASQTAVASLITRASGPDVDASAEGQKSSASAADHFGEPSQVLRTFPEIRLENWAHLDKEARLVTLQHLEKAVAKIEGRPPARVVARQMGPSEFGEYNRQMNTIALNESYLDNVQETLDTVIHEGRHAYQWFVVEHGGDSNAAAWRANFKNYLDPRIYGQELYERQPVEADARKYAAKVLQCHYEDGRSDDQSNINRAT